MPNNLRAYQKTAVNAVLREWSGRNTAGYQTLIVAPTGSGKSEVGSAVVLSWSGIIGHLARTLVIVQSKNLLYQQARHFRAKGWRVTLVGDSHHNLYGQVVVGTVQALAIPRMLNRVAEKSWDCIIVDECHHGITHTHQRVVRTVRTHHPQCRVVGLTATPMRWDKIGLREMFGTVAHIAQVRTLIRQGYLARPIQIKTAARPTLAELYEAWFRVARTRRTIAFTTSVEEAWDARDFFEARGVRCGVVSAKTPYTLRLRIERTKQVIFNVGVYTEGKDAPEIGCVLLFKGHSWGAYMQRIGRAMRPDTRDCYLIGPYHHDILRDIQVAEVLGKARPEVVKQNRPPSLWQRLFRRFLPQRSKNMKQGVPKFLSGKENDEDVISLLEEMIESHEDKMGVRPTMVAVVYDHLYTPAVAEFCTEQGLTRIPAKGQGVTLSPTNGLTIWVGHEKGTAKLTTKPPSSLEKELVPSDTFLAHKIESRDEGECLCVVFRNEPTKVVVHWYIEDDVLDSFENADDREALYERDIRDQYETTVEEPDEELLAEMMEAV